MDAGRQVAQLRQLLRLVGELSGEAPTEEAELAGLEEAAQISSEYADALPIVRRRFDALAAETAVWSAAAVEALLAGKQDRSPAAACRLADELHNALAALKLLLRR